MHNPSFDHFLALHDAPHELLDVFLEDLGQPQTALETYDWVQLSRGADESALRLAVPIVLENP